MPASSWSLRSRPKVNDGYRGTARANRAQYTALIQGNYSYIAKSEEKKGERRKKMGNRPFVVEN